MITIKHTRTIILGICMIVAAGLLGAQEQRVTYIEGEPELRRGSRSLALDFGEELNSGDTIYTGLDDLVELEQGTGNTISVLPDSVFSVQDVATGDQVQRRLTAARGGATFRFSRPGGSRFIGTATTAAGVRGTEFTVFASSDCAAFYVVHKGQIEVESQGQSVQVAANQAVEVAPGEPPGEVISWLGKTLDYSEFSSWNQKRIDTFLENPQATITGITEELVSLANDMEKTYMEYQASQSQLSAAREEMKRLQQEAEESDFQEYRQTVVFPLMTNTGNLFLNYRYFALSALSLRRNVGGSLYVQAKARLLLEPDSLWKEYMEDHALLVSQFEQRIVPMLNEGDI
ncbi:MAG: hypothetical protein D6B26_03465 [Spirochaetaceae bacterium]|nr:MAG: hypothetical protein D6B26_03465 [Spirochaetaceae bacterium]